MSYFYGIDEPRLPWPFAYQGQPARFEEIRRPRGREIDLAIASHAILQEATLWTLNTSDFADIPGLVLAPELG